MSPCFAAMGALNSELQSKKWLVGAIAFQLIVGFTIGFAVYQIGTVITTGTFGAGLFAGIAVLIVFASVIIGIIARNRKTFETEYQLG